MAEDLEQKVAETKEEGKKKFMEVAEFRMLVYVIPVATIILILALVLGK